MSIIRAQRPHSGFTVVRNDVAQDSRLSFRARGLLIYILSLPDNWRTDSVTLAKEGVEGRDAIRKCLTEMETTGYLKRLKTQNELGHWETLWYVYDHPETTNAENTEDGFPVIGNSGTIERTNTNNLLIELQPAVDAPITAREVVGAYVDTWVELHGEKPLARQIGQLSREARVLLEQGVEPTRLIDSAKKCATDGHARLDSAYAWITANGTRSTTSSARSDNLNTGLNLVKHFEAQEGQQIEAVRPRQIANNG
jgi:hypothetical protein